VARAKIADVVGAALKGKVAPWRKYCQGGFGYEGHNRRSNRMDRPDEGGSYYRRRPAECH